MHMLLARYASRLASTVSAVLTHTQTTRTARRVPGTSTSKGSAAASPAVGAVAIAGVGGRNVNESADAFYVCNMHADLCMHTPRGSAFPDARRMRVREAQGAGAAH